MGAEQGDRPARVAGGVALGEDVENRGAQRLDRRDHEEQAERRELRPDSRVLEDVLDLGGDVEGEVREAGVDGAGGRQGVGHGVEEVGVAVAQVARAHPVELADVGEQRLAPDHPDAPVVDHRDRQCRQRWTQPRVASTVAASRSSPSIRSRA